MNDPIMKALDGIEEKINSYKTEQLVLADRMLQIEQKGFLRNEGTQHAGTTTGDLFIKQFEASKDLFGKTGSLRLEIKAATDNITTTSGRTIISGGVGAPGGKFLGIQNALPTRPTAGTTAIEYSRYTGLQGAAEQQAAEGGAKAAVRPDHTLITQAGLTIAGYAKMSRQALNDSAELRSAVDLTLMRSVAGSMNAVLSSGGTGFTGFVALASAVTSATYTRLADAVSETIGTMQLLGFNPDVVVLSPGTWTLLITAQDTIGNYLSDTGYLAPLPKEMRGLRVELSTGVTAGKALVMDSTHSELLIANDFSVEVGYVGSDFTNNLVTILGEARVIPVFRSVGSAYLVTPKPAV